MAHGLQRAISSRSSWNPIWVALLVGCSVGILAVDAVLLEWSQHPFTGGMAARYSLRAPGTIALYGSTAWLLDVSLILGAWAITVPLLRRCRLRASQQLLIAALVAVAVPWVFSFTRYRIQIMLGPRLDFDLLISLAGGSLRELISQAGIHWLPVIGFCTIALALTGLAFHWLRGVESQDPRLAAPSTAALWLSWIIATAISLALLGGTCAYTSGVCEGVLDKPSALLVTSVAAAATDFDRDGTGWLARPPDPAPINPRIHPLAVDVPGNGIDENGLAGDHPIDFISPHPVPPNRPRFTRRPDVLLVLLETFRADLLEKRVRGQEVTPFLNRLALQGSSSKHAHASIPTTIGSRAQLLGGRIAPFPGQTTLLDDFAANGYFIAYFSGQDESFGARSEEILSIDAADVFYDARQDPERNTSTSDTPGHRAVSWKLLNQRVREFLKSYAGPKPLFLYVNYHDTHYPYQHRELDNLLDVEPLPPEEIGPDTAEAVRDVYANAAANVDHAIEMLVTDFQKSVSDRDSVIVVTADHGENLFEDGLLGHGLALSREETRVPLVVSGLGGDWPEPFALSDLRGAITSNLSLPADLPVAGSPLRPNWVPDPKRRILHLVPEPSRPSLLRLRGLQGSLLYDFKSGRRLAFGRNEQSLSPQPDDWHESFAELVRTWEAALIALDAENSSLTAGTKPAETSAVSSQETN